MQRWIKYWGLDLLAGIALLLAAMVLGCQTSGAVTAKGPSAPPQVETRAYDIRDLILAVPDFIRYVIPGGGSRSRAAGRDQSGDAAQS